MKRKIITSLLFLLTHFFVNAQTGNINLTAHANQAIILNTESSAQGSTFNPGYLNKDTTLNPTKDAVYYQGLSKKKKSAAFVKLSVGTALMGAGLLLGNRKETSFGDAGTGLVIGLVGFIINISSLSSFSKAYKYKQKAKLMMTSLSTGKGLPEPKNQKGIYSGSITSVSLIVPLGK